MNASLNGHKKLDPTTGMDDGGALAKLMRSFYAELVSDAFVDANGDGVAVAFSLDNPYVQTVLDRLAKQVKGVAETTKDEIRALVGRQAAEGWSIERLAQEITDQGLIAAGTEQDPGPRVRMIARTETASAYTQGSIAAYKASGVVSGVKWLASADSCAICQALDGEVRGLDEAFGDGIDSVPAHPNCTCVLSPVVKD